MRILVLCPHFAPDTAPTGTVMTRIVEELAARGHHIEVVTALPWYRSHAIEPGWAGKWSRSETTPWGRITRVHPFPGNDKRNLLRRAVGFAGFNALSTVVGMWRPADAVIAMSPPLTMGLAGWLVRTLGRPRGPLIFNIQDVFPDAAIQTGALTNTKVIAAARWLERISYRRSDAVTVLSDDLAANVRAKLPQAMADRVHVIPNFVDAAAITVELPDTAYRAELGIADDQLVVMYAGNVGFSQSLELMIGAARALPDVQFVINGGGSAKASLQEQAAGLGNVRFGDFQPAERLSEVLATGDVHVVALRAGLGAVSVPSKTYSILAAGRPVLASIDPDTEVTRMLEASAAGVAVPPDDQQAFTAALTAMIEDRAGLGTLGANGRAWVETAMSPAAVAEAYETLIEALRR